MRWRGRAFGVLLGGNSNLRLFLQQVVDDPAGVAFPQPLSPTAVTLPVLLGVAAGHGCREDVTDRVHEIENGRVVREVVLPDRPVAGLPVPHKRLSFGSGKATLVSRSGELHAEGLSVPASGDHALDQRLGTFGTLAFGFHAKRLLVAIFVGVRRGLSPKTLDFSGDFIDPSRVDKSPRDHWTRIFFSALHCSYLASSPLWSPSRIAPFAS